MLDSTRNDEGPVGAGCINWACPDLCGGRPVMGVPTAFRALDRERQACKVLVISPGVPPQGFPLRAADGGAPRYIGRPVCVGSVGFQSVRRAATLSTANLGPSGRGGLNSWRLNGQLRGAGKLGAARQAKSQGLCRPAAHGPARGADRWAPRILAAVPTRAEPQSADCGGPTY